MANFKRPRPHTTSYAVDKYKHIYLPLQAWGGFEAIANASDQADIAIEDAVQSVAAGNPSMGEVSTFGFSGLHIDAAGDSVGILWAVPYDCDVKSAIDFRVWWSSASTTAADTITWKILYDEFTTDSEAIAVPASTLSTAIAADTNHATANVMQATAWGTLNGGTLTNGRMVGLYVEADAGDMTFGSEATYGYQLEIRYIRRVL